MKITETALPGVVLIEPTVFPDTRGFFMELYQVEKYNWLKTPFLQDNYSRSKHGVLRGLHYQWQYPQGKLVMALRGQIFDVAVDVQEGSPTYGQWVGVVLSDDPPQQLYIPPGFAHGFCVLSSEADVLYKCTTLYHAPADTGIAWNDPDIGIAWPLSNVSISEKDARLPFLKDQVLEKRLHYEKS